MSPLLRLMSVFVLLVPWGAQAQGWLASATGSQQPEFLEAKDVFRVEATEGDDGRTLLRGSIAPGYYLYRHRLSVVADGADLPLTLSKGTEKTDEFFGRTEVYRDAVDIVVNGGGVTRAVLHWQGCADAGICYPPQTMPVELPFVAMKTAAKRAERTVGEIDAARFLKRLQRVQSGEK